MRKSIRTSAWLGALLALVLLFAAEGADAHEYFVGNNVPLPEGLDGKRFVQVNVGRTLTLTVKNAPMQSCFAIISPTNFDTATISVSSPQALGPVQTRVFKITGEKVGTTDLDITVQGVDPCTEDSHNHITVQVLPDQTEILRSFGVAGKNESKLLKLELKAGYSALTDNSKTALDGFANGTVAPDAAALTLVDGWYDAWAGAYFSGRQTLRNLSNYGSTLLDTGGWAECTSPFGFADGTRGSYDAMRSNVRLQLDGFNSKLDRQIALDTAAYRKIGLKYGISFTGAYDLSPYPEVDVSGPTTSTRPADPDAPLHIGYTGSVSWSTEFDTRSCAFVAGISAPASGPVRVQLWDGTGMVGSKVVTPEGLGTWDVMFDALLAGKMYRFTADYDGGDPGHATRRIFLPRHDF